MLRLLIARLANYGPLLARIGAEYDAVIADLSGQVQAKVALEARLSNLDSEFAVRATQQGASARATEAALRRQVAALEESMQLLDAGQQQAKADVRRLKAELTEEHGRLLNEQAARTMLAAEILRGTATASSPLIPDRARGRPSPGPNAADELAAVRGELAALQAAHAELAKKYEAAVGAAEGRESPSPT